MSVLGLDISSSMIGVAVAERNEDGKIVPTFLDHIRLDNIDGIFNKHDYVVKRLTEMMQAGHFHSVTDSAVEAPLLGFQSQKSSADTIITLIRMNILVLLTVRAMFGKDPTFISSSTARKLAGVKVQRTSVAGKNAKEQVFEHMCKHDLSHVSWPLRKLGKRKGEPVELARDMTDAWVIAKARVQQG